MKSLKRSCFIFLLLTGVGISTASAQPTFSIDFQGPTIGIPDFYTGVPVTEADILVATPPGFPTPGPLPVPGTVVRGGNPPPGPSLGLALYPFSVGHAPGVAGRVEVDALSYGRDLLLDAVAFPGVWTFSVDEFAVGLGPVVVLPPSVATQGAAGAGEASADVFANFPPGAFPPGPLGPGATPPPGNADLIDGDGLAPPPGPHPAMPFIVGFGLIEPNAPTPFFLPDPGDNLDALDVDTGGPPGSIPFPIFFSLDTFFPDPLEAPPPPGTGPVNSGSAAAHGFVGGDVLITPFPGAAPAVYAAAAVLGLDALGPDRDDLDALVLVENGVAGYQPSVIPYDWGPAGTDMLMFSVRRGSAVIGMPDSIFFLPIEEGDILVPPVGGAPGAPGIFIAAENLGLATVRSGAVPMGDDLDALDVSADCNTNGVPDRLDLIYGLATDCNANMIPDVCEQESPPVANCSDGADNDCDGFTDCADPDCAGTPTCLCGNGNCDPGETPCTCPADCGGPVPEIGPRCGDGLDNDCDGFIDCADPGCAGNPLCTCGNGMCAPPETPCTCPADCGLPVAEGPGLCADGIDNDCNGFTDCADPGCAADPVCLCPNGACVPPENPCTCPADCGLPAVEAPGLCADGIDNDCDGFTDCADPGCAPDPVCLCPNGACVPPENPCTCPADCGLPAVEAPGLCADGIDNDCDGFTDCADPGCAADPVCLCGNGACVAPENPCTCPADCGLPAVEAPGLCADGIDNDCDGFTDCADPGCAADPVCLCGNGACVAPENPCTCPADCGLPAVEAPGLCADGIDNDCDGFTDCADPGCAADPVCLCGNGACVAPENPCTCPADCGLPAVEAPGLCADGIDNDCDGFTDCADPGCAADPVCLCGNGACVAPENPCTCPADCGLPAVEAPGLCADGIDNDCDGFTDCADPGCAADPVCLCANGACVPPENPCTCPADCGLPAVEAPGLCADGIDNDCDGFTDCADPGCALDPVCLCPNGACVPPENPCTCPADCGLPAVEAPGLCADGIDNDCDGFTDCADPGCAPDPVCLCPNGACVPPENPCTCPADCGPPAVEGPGLCADGIDNDCDGFTDCADPACESDPICPCVCEGDVDFDGDADECDLLIVGNCAKCESNPLPPSCGNPMPVDCDVNCDGTVDLLDFGDEQCLQYLPASECCDPPHGACSDTSLFQGCLKVPELFCAQIGGAYAGDDTDCPPGSGDCNGNGIGDGCEPQQCTSDSECDDLDVCTCDFCVCGVCYNQPREYGDTNCDCLATDVDDILCVLDCFIYNGAICPTADIDPPCTGNGLCDVDDILEVLRVFKGESQCFACTAPCPFGACCDGLDCRVTTPADCITSGDEYKGDGTACPPLAPDPCP